MVYSPFRRESMSEELIAEVLAFKSWAAEAGVPVLDMTQAYGTRPEAEVYHDACHLNAAGHLIIARAIEADWGRLTAGNP